MNDSDRNLDNKSSSSSRTVITIGTFDGVHIGHQSLLEATVKKAKELTIQSLVITYLKHPIEIMNEIVYPYLLTESEKRELLIKKKGIDNIMYLDFDKEMSKLEPLVFLKEILIKKYYPLAIIVGYDTHFGFNREGNVELLERYQEEFGYKVFKISPCMIEGKTISSTIIRNLISYGEMEEASKYLGYHYSVLGKVVHGKKIGRTLDIPTLNLQPIVANKLIPEKGVYYTYTRIDDKIYYGTTNIGVAPTIKDDNKMSIETHLLDFDDFIYGKEVELFFISKIRNEQRFDSTLDLQKQIKKDLNYVKNTKINI